MELTVPCGIYAFVPGSRDGRACGGTCQLEARNAYGSEGEKEIIAYKCDRCGHRTSRYVSGKPLPAWDGLLRDGSSYYDSCVDENDWRL